MDQPAHQPVMLAEVLKALAPVVNGRILDGTVGAGGHAEAILEAGEGQLLGIDRDPRAVQIARARLERFGSRAVVMEGSYDEAHEAMKELGWEKVEGMVFDLGVSSMQLDEPARGFAFSAEGPLDMRMGRDGPTAGELVNTLPEAELARIFSRYGQEPLARAVARAIVRARARQPITTTTQLAEIVSQAMGARRRAKARRHPATRVFMALRIAVNEELARLGRLLERFVHWLAPGGVIVILTYHSLEDRLVKRAFAALARPCTCPPSLAVCVCGRRPLLTLPPGQPLCPSAREIQANPRARSAKMRIGVRTEHEPWN